MRASKSLSPASRESHRASNHCEHLSSRCAPSRAACIQTGCQDRSTYTACTNAIQTRTLDISPAHPATPFRTAHTATPHAFPAYSPDAARRLGLCATEAARPRRTSPPACARHLDCPDTQVVGIWPQEPPQAVINCLAVPLPAASTRSAGVQPSHLLGKTKSAESSRLATQDSGLATMNP